MSSLICCWTSTYVETFVRGCNIYKVPDETIHVDVFLIESLNQWVWLRVDWFVPSHCQTESRVKTLSNHTYLSTYGDALQLRQIHVPVVPLSLWAIFNTHHNEQFIPERQPLHGMLIQTLKMVSGLFMVENPSWLVVIRYWSRGSRKCS